MSAAYLQAPVVRPLEWRSGCSGKNAFSSEADAKRAARKLNFKQPPYCCRHCGHWHITSQGKLRT